MPKDSNTLLRSALGDNLQTGAIRAVLILAAFSVLGALIGLLFR